MIGDREFPSVCADCGRPGGLNCNNDLCEACEQIIADRLASERQAEKRSQLAGMTIRQIVTHPRRFYQLFREVNVKP